jgi:hypothetical protein
MMAAMLMTAVLANSVWIMRCPLSASAGEQSGVPDCCKNGMCPHHAAEHQHCQCDLFSDTAASMNAASIMPATFFPPVATAIVLPPAGAAMDATSIRLPEPILIPSTPPPKA